MTTSLESLNSGLFEALTSEESALVVGGLRGYFTYIGMTNVGGNLERDHEWDQVIWV